LQYGFKFGFAKLLTDSKSAIS